LHPSPPLFPYTTLFRSIEAASHLFATPERNHSRCPLGGGNDHTVGFDALQTPGAGPEEKCIADAALIDELFIQLADVDSSTGIRSEEHTSELQSQSNLV